MIQKWKEISKEICIRENRKNKDLTNKDKKNKLIKKWDQLRTNKDNKISKTIKVKLKVKNKLMSKLTAENKDSNNLLTTNNNKNKLEKDKIDHNSKNKDKKRNQIGMIIMSKDRK